MFYLCIKEDAEKIPSNVIFKSEDIKEIHKAIFDSDFYNQKCRTFILFDIGNSNYEECPPGMIFGGYVCKEKNYDGDSIFKYYKRFINPNGTLKILLEKLIIIEESDLEFDNFQLFKNNSIKKYYNNLAEEYTKNINDCQIKIEKNLKYKENNEKEIKDILLENKKLEHNIKENENKLKNLKKEIS